MKMKEVANIIEGKEKTDGYMVRFEWYSDGFISSDSFPAENEPLIRTEAEAWMLAMKFAQKTVGKCRMIFVADHNGIPVDGFKERMLNKPE